MASSPTHPASREPATVRKRRAQPRPLALKLLYTLLAVAVFFALLEGLLAICGVRASADRADPLVGFAGGRPLFVEEPAPDGTVDLVTAEPKLTWFNAQRFPREKPPQTKRIFCLGGSTTYGRPYDDATSFCGWLRAFLPVADPTRRWEVINAGGISYASYRVARVMAELAEYSPDLFIIYSGHNEFLEQRTYTMLAGSSEATRQTIGWLSQLRTFAALRSVVRPDQPTQSAPPRQNVLPAEVETLLDSSVGLDAYHRDRDWERGVAADYRRHLERMLDVAEASGVPAILVVPASQLRDCSPFKSEHAPDLTKPALTAFRTAYESALAAQQQGDLPDALAHVEAALAIDPQYAHAQYLRGTLLWELQRPEEARAAFIRARDEDICPLRATTGMCDIVREVARARHVPLVDFVALTQSLAESGVPGADLFLDHVHPTIEGHRQLALQLVDKLSNIGALTPSPNWDAAAVARVTAEVESRIDPEAHARALLNLSKVLSWAGKYAEADRLALQAGELLQSDAEALYQAAGAKYRAGDLPGALRLFEQAAEVDPTSGPAHYGVGLVLAETGRLDEALSAYARAAQLRPQQLEIRFNYGNALSDAGDFSDAEREYRAAIRIQPDFAPSHNGLGIALVQQGKLPEAIAAFQRGVALDPGDVETRSNLARAEALASERSQ